MIRSPEFMKIRAGKPFSLKRPSFLEGTIVCDNREVDELPPNRRTGENNAINRLNFLAAPIAGRLIDFETSVQTGIDKLDLKAEYLIVKDITDVEWTTEETRLRGLLTTQFTQVGRSPEIVKALVDKELSINKPLNRDQRTIRKLKEDIISVKELDFDLKLQSILQEVKDNSTNVITNTTNIMNILQNISVDTQISIQQQNNLKIVVDKLGLPKNHRDLGLVDIFGNEYFKRNQGLILLYMIHRYRSIGSKTLARNMITKENINTPSSLITKMSSDQMGVKINLKTEPDGQPRVISNTAAISRIEAGFKSGDDLRFNFTYKKEFESSDIMTLLKAGVDVSANNVDQSTLTVSMKVP